MTRNKIFLSSLIITLLVFSFSCNKQKEQKIETQDLYSQVCEIADGKWSFYVPPKGKTELDCSKNDCRRKLGLLKLRCIDNKITGEAFASLSSESRQEYWDKIESSVENEKVILTAIHYYYPDEQKEPNMKRIYEIEKVENNRFFGSYTMDAFFNSKNRDITKHNFIAIKNK